MLPFFLFLFISWIPTHAQIVLFDQSTPATTSGLVAQDFENLFNGNDCRIADDFTVPSGETWYIDSIRIFGFYNVNNPDTAGMNVTIYNDNSGSVGSSVFSDLIDLNLDPDEDGTIVASWSTPIQLSAGDYWLAASARKDYLNDQGVWYWYLNSSTSSGSTALWENPNGGWNAGCTSWTAITANSCVDVDHPNVVFQIHGCYGPTKPSVNDLGNDTTFCEGPAVTLNAGSSSSGVAYFWNTGDSTQSIVVTTAGYYTVVAYDTATLCGSSASINMNIIPAPKSTIVNDTICPGQSRTFGVNNCSTCEYLWNDGSTSNFLTVSSQGWVSVTMTDTVTGCVGVDSGWLEVQPLAQPQFEPDDVVHICKGDTVSISTTQNYDSYTWTSTAWSAPVANEVIEVYLTGTYYLTVTSANGCIATDSVEVTVHDPPEPEVTIDYTASWKTRLTATPGFQTYEWDNGDDDNVRIANSTGTYSLTVTDEFGCEGTVTLFVIVTGTENPVTQQLRVYPNPTSESLWVEWPEAWLNNAQIAITDLSGRTVQEITAQVLKQQVDIKALTSGHYLLRVSSPDGPGAIPIIKE